jgi:diguanylate cyclase (GGDEF)-like protein
MAAANKPGRAGVLMDRDGFNDRLAVIVRDAPTAGGLLFVDLDHFNVSLNAYGGRTNSVLARVALLLADAAADHGDVARLGGADYGILLEQGDATLFGRDLARRIADTNFGTAAAPLYLTASIGVVPFDGGHAANVAEMVCTADAAVYAARNSGGNRAVALRLDDELAVRSRQAIATLPLLRDALRNGRIQLYCQPIVPLRSNDMSQQAAEILARLLTPDGEIMLPNDFLPVADRFRLTSMFDRAVIEQSCAWLESHARSWVDLGYVTVNLHAQSLADEDLKDWLVRRISNGQFDSRRICIEVTESAAIQNLTHAAQFLNRLRETGCRVALDDFGAGYSSLAHFQSLPVDIVKLDGGFMGNIVEDAAAREMVAWICDLCRAADRRTVAEHCSSPDILEAVRALGIDYAQGHAVCEPFPLEHLLHAEEDLPPEDQSPAARNIRYAGLSVSST